MSNIYTGQSPLQTNSILTTSGASATPSSFPNTIESVRARIHDVVRSIDDVMGAAQHVSSPTVSKYASVSASVSSPRVDFVEVKGKGGGRRPHGASTSSSVAVGMRGDRLEPKTLGSAEPGTFSGWQPPSRQHSVSMDRCLSTSGVLPAAMPGNVFPPREGFTCASTTSDTETTFSATYAATLEYWRTTGRSTVGPMPAGRAGHTASPGVASALVSSVALAPSAAPLTDAHNSHVPASTIPVLPQPPLYSKERGVTGMSVPTDSTVKAALSSNVLLPVAAPATEGVDHTAVFAAPPRPRQGAPPASPTSTAKRYVSESSLSIPDSNHSHHQLSPRALVDDSHFYTSAPAPLPTPSSVNTLSARLAALRAADAAQHRLLLEQQKQRQGPYPNEGGAAYPWTAATMAKQTAPLGDYSLRAHQGHELSTNRYLSSGSLSAYHQKNWTDSQCLQQSSLAVDTSASIVTSDPNTLVRSPPSMHQRSPTAEARRAQRLSRQEETSFIVSLAQQQQATREELWRDAQADVKHELPLRPPPPLPSFETSVLARSRPSPRFAQHHGGGSGDRALCAFTNTTERRSNRADITSSLPASTSLSAPIDALPARLSSSALVVPKVGRDMTESDSLPLHEELAMRERLIARRQQQSENALAVHDWVTEPQRRHYERLFEARDGDTAEHLRGVLARQTAVQVAAQARVAHVRAAFPDQPEFVTSGELLAIRQHAHELEQLREQMQRSVGGAYPFQVKSATALPADVVSATNSSSLRTPTVAIGKTCSRAGEADVLIGKEATTTVQPSCTTAGAAERQQHSPENTVIATASPCTIMSDAATNTCAVDSDDRDGRDSAGVQSARHAKTPSPSPVKPQRAAMSFLPGDVEDGDSGRAAGDAQVQSRCVPRFPDATLSSTQQQRTLAVPALEDAEHGRALSYPLRGSGGKGTGSLTPERLASIHSTRLYVSSQRGTEWQEDSTASDASSSSLPRVSPTPASPVRPSRSAFLQEGGVRPPVSSTRDRRKGSPRSASSHPSATPAAGGTSRSGVVSAGRTRALTPHRTTKSAALLSKRTEPIQAHQRIVQREVSKCMALRAQAILAEHGVGVDVCLVERHVSALLRLSKDRRELLFYLDRVEQVPQPSPCASPLPSKVASSGTSPLRSLYSVGLGSHLPLTSSAPETVSRAPPLPRRYPPLSPSAAVSLASSGHPPEAPTIIAPFDTSVRGKAVMGRGGGVVGAPSRGFAQSPSQQQQPPVYASPSQSVCSVPLRLPSSSPLPSRSATATLPRRSLSPSAGALTRPIHVRELHHFPCAYSRVYVPFGVMGYESDRGLGGPRTWEDVSDVLCGPASFEVLRRYRCPLFAGFEGKSWAPYRVYLIIPEFERIDEPKNAVLLVLDFRQRVDWVLFLLATQHSVRDRCMSHNGVDGKAHAPLMSRNGSNVGSPVLSYGRALWMLAVQRLHRARALRRASPLISDMALRSRFAGQHDSRGAGGNGGGDAPAMGPSYVDKGAVHPLAGGGAPISRFAYPPDFHSGSHRGAASRVRSSSKVDTSSPPREQKTSPAHHRDPKLDWGRGISPAAGELASRTDGRADLRGWNSGQQRTHPARSHGLVAPPLVASVQPLSAQETSKPRFALLRRVSRGLRFGRVSKDE